MMISFPLGVSSVLARASIYFQVAASFLARHDIGLPSIYRDYHQFINLWYKIFTTIIPRSRQPLLIFDTFWVTKSLPYFDNGRLSSSQHSKFESKARRLLHWAAQVPQRHDFALSDERLTGENMSFSTNILLYIYTSAIIEYCRPSISSFFWRHLMIAHLRLLGERMILAHRRFNDITLIRLSMPLSFTARLLYPWPTSKKHSSSLHALICHHDTYALIDTIFLRHFRVRRRHCFFLLFSPPP